MRTAVFRLACALGLAVVGRWAPATSAIGLLLCSTSRLAAAEGSYLCDTVPANPRNPLAIKASDVSMRALEYAGKDEAIAAGRGFHITRLDWCYSAKPEWIAQVRAEGWSYMGALLNQPTDRAMWRYTADGKWYIPHWFIWIDPKNPKHSLGCYNDPAYEDALVASGIALLDQGCQALHKDDSEGNYASLRDGCCFCSDCAAKAKAQGVDLHDAKQMRTFQLQSTLDFYKRVRQRLEKHAGHAIALSGNLEPGSPVMAAFDFAIKEITKKSAGDLLYLRGTVDKARAEGKAVAYTAQHDWGVDGFRKGLALITAAGSNLIVPWDQYMDKVKGRLFMKPADLADLYGFIRAVPALLDGYEDAAVAGPGFKKGSDAKLATLEAGDRAAAWIRVQPRKRAAGVVVHLLGCDRKGGGTLRLARSQLFAGAGVTARLMRPVPYDAAMHAAAEKARDYAALAGQTKIPVREDGDWLVLDLPPVELWGILVLEPAAPAGQLRPRDDLRTSGRANH